MMNPVVRVMLQRAESRRHSLLALAEVIPGDYIDRIAAGESWSARIHLIHALAVDQSMAALIDLVVDGAQASDLGAALEGLAAARSRVLHARQTKDLATLIGTSQVERRRLVDSLTLLEPSHLDVVMPLPGARNAWGDPLGISVYLYLEQWTNHDAVHEEAIRAAIATKPDLSTVALTQRFRQANYS